MQSTKSRAPKVAGEKSELLAHLPERQHLLCPGQVVRLAKLASTTG